jgi:hypothetical protein
VNADYLALLLRALADLGTAQFLVSGFAFTISYSG